MRATTLNDAGLAAAIGQRVRDRRRELRLSQGDLAAMIRIKQGPLSNIERGHHVPTGRVALALADALGMSIDEMFGRPASPANSRDVKMTTDRPASAKRPAVIIAGRPYQPNEPGPDGQPAADHLRRALYSGRIEPGDWAAAERFLELTRIRAGSAVGGAASGQRKARGGAAFYQWVTACRVAKRAGLPRPPKPEAKAQKSRAQ